MNPTVLERESVAAYESRAVRAPMRRPLGTSSGNIAHAPLVLIDLETNEGVPGRAYLFAYTDVAARALRETWQASRRWSGATPSHRW